MSTGLSADPEPSRVTETPSGPGPTEHHHPVGATEGETAAAGRLSAPASLVPRRLRWILRAGAVLLVLGLALGAWQLGRSGLLEEEELRSLVQGAGVWGPPLYLLAFAVGELLHVPSILFMFVAPLVWPLGIAIFMAWAGSVLAAMFVFCVARFLVGDWARANLPTRLRRYDDRLAERGLRTVAGLRLATFMAPLMHWVLGASRVSVRDAFLGTALGVLPGVVLCVALGQQILAHWHDLRPLVGVALAVLVFARIAWVIRRRLRAQRAEAGD